LKITEAAHILGYLFPQLRLRTDFDKKTGWATFWAILLKTHLVTLQKQASRQRGEKDGEIDPAQ
jgi:hypothetical protein